MARELLDGEAARQVVARELPFGYADAEPISRGTLCLAALAHHSVESALADVATRRLDDYDPFNLLVVDGARSAIVDNRDGCHVTELATGLSVLTNLDVNDPRCPRLASAHAGFEKAVGSLADAVSEEGVVEALAAVLRDHAGSADASGTDPFARVCVHAGGYGTRSSSIVILRGDGRVGYFHADGAPCRAPYRRITTEASASLPR